MNGSSYLCRVVANRLIKWSTDLLKRFLIPQTYNIVQLNHLGMTSVGKWWPKNVTYKHIFVISRALSLVLKRLNQQFKNVIAILIIKIVFLVLSHTMFNEMKL